MKIFFFLVIYTVQHNGQIRLTSFHRLIQLLVAELLEYLSDQLLDRQRSIRRLLNSQPVTFVGKIIAMNVFMMSIVSVLCCRQVRF